MSNSGKKINSVNSGNIGIEYGNDRIKFWLPTGGYIVIGIVNDTVSGIIMNDGSDDRIFIGFDEDGF